MSHIDVMKQALEYLQDNQHLIADNERHAYVREYNAFIERFEQAIAEAEQPAPAQPMTQDMVESCPYYAETLRGAYFDGWLKAEAAHGITKGNT